MTNNQNKGEKKCPFCGKIVANIFECDCPLGDMKIAPQSVEKELRLCPKCNTMKNMEFGTTECRQCFETSQVEKEVTGCNISTGNTNGEPFINPKEEVMENCQQCGSYICKCEVKEFIPQSNTLGTTMEEKIKEALKKADICYGWDQYDETDDTYEKPKLVHENDMLMSEIIEAILPVLSQSKAETIKECIEKVKDVFGYEDVINLLSKDIEQ